MSESTAVVGAQLRPVTATCSRCLVCGFAEVRTDEVAWRGTVLLAECPRCEHRWTENARTPAQTPPVRVVRRAPGESAAAA